MNQFSVFEKIIHHRELLSRLNDNLGALLTNIFKKYMINDDFEKSNLTQIANYKNGLAMQKYRPNSNEESLPVLKIKELNQGNTDDSSDRCSANLDNSVIANTGDIIFSWSGTLLVKNWTGDKAGLNQHLFKVTSNKYPAWFIYEWTKYHLLRFQAIAAGKATTMGHIKRSDLKSSLVYIPSQLFLEKMDSQLAPIYSQRLNLIKENQQLWKLKQTLLNKYF
ncbi:restriction endonuclease subunit S [Limosilactobacillus reuteri]|uniref:restriction endonuclease subunit S n=1 Tax=Limosilactobacillus reuteri TaxID=1598 RepID=UPI001F10E494|nr:restriction endonuclease subunit S [Limosilactobacillus reuteri]